MIFYNVQRPNTMSLRSVAIKLLLNPLSFLYKSKKIDILNKKIEKLKWKKRLSDVGVPQANQIFSYTKEDELQALYELASNSAQGSIALEIGSHLGASSCYLAAGLAQVGGQLFCVDTWNNETMPEGTQDTWAEFHKNTAGVKQQIVPIRKRSDEVSESDLKLPLNLVFIDGDHSYTGVKQDFDRVQNWLAKDGIIAFHDFGNPDYEGVSRVIGEALASGKWTIVGYVRTLVWIKPATWSVPRWV